MKIDIGECTNEDLIDLFKQMLENMSVEDISSCLQERMLQDMELSEVILDIATSLEEN